MDRQARRLGSSSGRGTDRSTLRKRKRLFASDRQIAGNSHIQRVTDASRLGAKRLRWCTSGKNSGDRNLDFGKNFGAQDGAEFVDGGLARFEATDLDFFPVQLDEPHFADAHRAIGIRFGLPVVFCIRRGNNFDEDVGAGSAAGRHLRLMSACQLPLCTHVRGRLTRGWSGPLKRAAAQPHAVRRLEYISMQTAQVLEHFSAMLRARFTAGVFTTEDSVRYTFYSAASLYGGIRHTEVVLEFPHPVIEDARIDTIINGCGGTRLDCNRVQVRPGQPWRVKPEQNATSGVGVGGHFPPRKDSDGDCAQRYFIYVTDSEMAAYFKNPANRLCEFFDLSASRALPLGAAAFLGFSQTFRDRVDPHACECQVKGMFAADLGKDVSMRAFEVLTAYHGDGADNRRAL